MTTELARSDAPGRATRVLAVDDLDANLRLIRRLLPPPEFIVRTASTPDEAISAVTAFAPDVLLLDVRMPDRDGFGICGELKSHPVTRFVAVILITATSDPSDRLKAIEAGADDFVPKPLNPTELTARVRALARVKRYTDELESAEQLIITLATTIEARDAYTEGHCQRLARYGRALGAALGLTESELRALERGGYLHDVGKIGVPDAVLLKPGPLTASESALMKTHTIIGERLCEGLRSLSAVRPIVRSHHERLDGSGYPDGLKGTQLPLLAEIIGLVDVYDALSSRRPYRGPLPHEEVVRTMRAEVRQGWRREELTELWLELATQ
jgi:putative two-component system response regulator